MICWAMATASRKLTDMLVKLFPTELVHQTLAGNFAVAGQYNTAP